MSRKKIDKFLKTDKFIDFLVNFVETWGKSYLNDMNLIILLESMLDDSDLKMKHFIFDCERSVIAVFITKKKGFFISIFGKSSYSFKISDSIIKAKGKDSLFYLRDPNAIF